MLIPITRIQKNKNKISKNEFNITKMLLDSLDVEFESDYSMTKDYSPLLCGDRILSYTEFYNNIDSIPKENVIFRPLKNERHSNILIEMFEESIENISMDKIEITEYLNKHGKKRYSGYIISHGHILKDSKITSAPSIPILKTSIVARTLLNKNDYEEYTKYLRKFLTDQKDDKHA